MTTAQDLIEESRRYLFAGQRENMNSLAAALTDTTGTTVSFSYDLGQIKPGAYIAIDLEIMYVWTVSDSGMTATVQRGMLGSTAAIHLINSLTFVNSKFPAFTIFQALNADLSSLCSPTNGLFAIQTLEVTYNPAQSAYDLTATGDILDVLRVRSKQPGPSLNWFEVRRWQFKRNADTGVFPSGNALTVYDSGWAGLPIEVIYAAPFTPFTTTTSTVASTGLPASAADIPPLGAAMRLAGVRETQRNFNESQGDTRRATEVPPGAQMQGVRGLMQLRQMRIHDEANKLTSSYPPRRQG